VGDPKHETFLPVEGFLEKPVDRAVLLAEVERLLRVPKAAEKTE